MKKILVCLAFLAIALSSSAQTALPIADLIIRNGKVLDGSGNSWFYGDVAIKDGKILRVGNLGELRAAKTIDAKGLILAPGFIDVHGHIEKGVVGTPTADNYILDGVTTVITGNCGGSEENISGYLRLVDSIRPSINIASLIGHNTVRAQVLQRANRAPSADEQKQMDELVAKAMRNGAVGLSTGLIYIPGTFAKTEEVVSLAKAAARYNGVYASHIRDEENNAVEAINEAINIGKEANIPVQISHFKVGGKSNWGKSNITLGLIKKAREDGWEVTIDQYPYTASSTNLGVRLPDWTFQGGDDSMKVRLTDPETRSKIKKEMLQQLKDYAFPNYSYAVVASYAPDSTYNGKNISQINKLLGKKSNAKNEAETIMDMVLAGGAQMVYNSMNEDDVKHIMKYPFSMFAADAGIRVFGQGMPHPRGYGTNARVLGKYVRDEKVISLEDAIRRMTSLPAQKFGLNDRGHILPNFAADIVIFSEAEVQDLSTFQQPHAYSKGFKYVIVNGELVVENEKHLGTKSGRALYGQAYVK
ncbi:N-acyl-D-amino-acid deacylase family protein [Daejeonella sp.]|uniref:N-acyl-D-amino-acid deacylase family protein n=1 Tax=Daejeonella sp. TaxID=2805397 RepID=UPI003983BCF6